MLAINSEAALGRELYIITSLNIITKFVIGFNITNFLIVLGKMDIGYITGVKYNNAVIKTEYKCTISLNLTAIAPKINPVPKENTITKSNGIIDNKIVQCSSARVANITQINAVKEAIKLMEHDNTLDTINKYFGIYIFLINGALPIIEVIELEVASEKKLKITCPLSKYNGKFSTSNLNKFAKTMESTIIMNNGFNKVQRTPNTDLLYLILMSLETNSFNNGRNLLKFCIYVDTF